MKYIFRSAEGVDEMVVVTEGNRVVSVDNLVHSSNGAPDITTDVLQSDLDFYMEMSGENIEHALASYAGGYTSVRKADDE